MRTRHTIALVMAVLVVACSSSDDVSTTKDTSLNWDSCSFGGAECALVDVPFDHDRPELGSFQLPVVRHGARVPEQRIGILFVNPGGPGSPGVWMAESPELYFSDVIVDRFDIIGFDPRGTGGSRPGIDCVDDMDAYFALDPSPDDSVERTTLIDAAQDFVDACSTRNDEILSRVGTEATARDIDLIRRRLGEESATYFGFSYGSELGAVWASSFPDTVRAAVFDAAADPTLDLIDWLTAQSRGFESSLEAFLDECDATGCNFTTPGETARQSFDRIMARLDTSPLAVAEGRAAVGQGVALIGVVSELYERNTWPELDRALAEADDGFGDRLITSYDDYFGGYRDGHPDDVVDAYVAITCLDRTRRFDVDDVWSAMESVSETSPRLGAVLLHELLLCALWPVAPSPPPDVRWTGHVPILVVGSTGDPATPLEGTRRMYETLGNARLIVVDSFDHTSYGSNDCATDAVDRYLVDLVVPDDELDC